MREILRKCVVATTALLLLAGASFAQRQMENLNRGLVAFNRSSSVYLSWRLLATDPSGIGFNVYCSTDGGTAVKLNSSVITATTDYTHTGATVTSKLAYYVKPVLNGVELAASETYTLAANSSVRQYIPITLQSISDGTYRVEHVYVGDLDGDGDYDYVVKRFLVSSTLTGTIKLEAYTNEGTFMWRVDLGPNVETTNSSMTSPVLVYDFNGDGKAEVLAKTGESTTFGDGTKIGDTNGDGVTDYNSYVYSDYAHILSGPEFISMMNGATGAEMSRANFIPRGSVSYWGDSYGARMNFIMAGVAYLDGVHPSAVFSRGPGDVMKVEAWNFTTGSLVKKWHWQAKGKTFTSGTSWVDFHQIKCVDVDGDGCDEISWGSGMLNNDSTVLYTTALVHGDRFQIGDFNPNRSGLEAYAIQQNNSTLLGAALYDAATGTILKQWYTSAVTDIGRGDVADIDPNTVGMELFSLASTSLQSCTGTDIATARQYPDISIWWDGDLCRESFVGIGSSGYNPAINKWNTTSLASDRMFTIYNDGGSYVVTCPYAGRAPFIGDILGDWREEVILETSDHSQLRVYSTVLSASNRVYALMQNPAYRIDVCTKGYLCSKYPDYYLGTGMSTPSTPNIYYVAKTPTTGSTYSIINKNSSKSVDVTAKSTSDGASIIQYTYSGGTNQQWIVTDLGKGYYKLVATHSSKCIGIASSSTTSLAYATQQTYTGVTSQQFYLADLGSNYYQIINRNSGMCLQVESSSTANSAKLQQAACGTGDNQKFLFTKLKALDAEPMIIADEAITEPQLKILSNPVSGNSLSFDLTLPEKSEVAVTVVDLSGHNVISKNLGILEGNSVQTIDIASLSTGTYIIQILTSTKMITNKFVRY
jgi:rhamnogalacturonan endolyase